MAFVLLGMEIAYHTGAVRHVYRHPARNDTKHSVHASSVADIMSHLVADCYTMKQ